jgi:tetratricopeptide (TPR) repeat protein
VYYAKKVYDLQPNYQVFYERYIQGLARLKDTAAIINAFKNLDDYKINANHYSATFGCLLKAGYGKFESFEFIKQGLNRFPEDSKLQEININFNKKTKVSLSVLTEKELQIKASKTNDYREIEKFYIQKYTNSKSDFSVVENLGICYFQQKKYALAIKFLNKVVAANAFQNGKSEYVISICYENLNNKKMACEMANLALQKNFQDAKIVIQNNCN